MAVIEVTDASFATDVLNSSKPVLVDYWASWCAPCRQLSPIIEELSTTYGDRMVFAKLETDVKSSGTKVGTFQVNPLLFSIGVGKRF